MESLLPDSGLAGSGLGLFNQFCILLMIIVQIFQIIYSLLTKNYRSSVSIYCRIYHIHHEQELLDENRVQPLQRNGCATGARVLWTIENFLDRKEVIGESILSPSFRVKHTGSKKTKWQIPLYPKGDIDTITALDLPGGDCVYVSVFLRGTSNIKKDHINVHVSIADCHLNRINEKELHYLPEKVSEDENMCYGDSIAFQREHLIFENDVKLPGESLTMEFKIDVSWNAVDEEFEDDCQSDKDNQKEIHDSKTKGKEKAIKDFGEMFENKQFCD